MAKENNKDITYDIVQHIGTITTKNSGWNIELNIISWNGQTPKFDIRAWSEDHEHMARGITLYGDEMKKLNDIYRSYKNQKTVDDAKAEKAELREKYANSRKPYPNDAELSHDTDAVINDEVNNEEADTGEYASEESSENEVTASQVAEAAAGEYAEITEATPF